MKFLMMLLLSLLISTSLYASDNKIISFTLVNGAKLSALKDVKKVFTTQDNKIDLIELNNGEIFYDTEILNTALELGDTVLNNLPIDSLRIFNDTGRVLAVTGDGSGGG